MRSVEDFRSLVAITFPCHFIYAVLDGGVGDVLCGVWAVGKRKELRLL
jgi:hypothetical protein